jgi:hypothetical protein
MSASLFQVSHDALSKIGFYRLAAKPSLLPSGSRITNFSDPHGVSPRRPVKNAFCGAISTLMNQS